MSDLPPLELLESSHTFPGPFVFKAIGRGTDDFIDSVVQVVRDELKQEFDPPYEVKHSSKGHHVSVTITPWVESAAQVLDVYQKLRGIDGLSMLL